VTKWVDILDGFYAVSDEGQIRSNRTGLLRKPQSNGEGNGYYQVIASVNGIRYYLSVHREVAKAFVPNPDNKPEVNHKDLDPSNNFYTNLEWSTKQENMDHVKLMGGLNSPRGIQINTCKLDETKVVQIRSSYRKGRKPTQCELADEHGVSQAQISDIVNDKCWSL